MNGITQVASAMVANERRLDAITSNLANASTTGFKRRLTASHGEWVGRRDAAQQGLVISERNDFAQGILQSTGNSLDLGIEGKGFFAVETPEGERFTRNGNFKLTQDGVLTTLHGEPVAWEGQAGNLQDTGEEIRVSSDGTVSQGESVLGQLRLVEFQNTDAMQHAGKGLWKAAPGDLGERATGSIQQGFLEGANVNAVHELVAMITVQRRFDQAAQTLTQIDQSYRRLHQSR